MDSTLTREIVVPNNTSVAFSLGTQVMIVRGGSGALSISEGSGVTINSSNDNKSLQFRYSGATLIKKSVNEWWLFGDLS